MVRGIDRLLHRFRSNPKDGLSAVDKLVQDLEVGTGDGVLLLTAEQRIEAKNIKRKIKASYDSITASLGILGVEVGYVLSKGSVLPWPLNQSAARISSLSEGVVSIGWNEGGLSQALELDRKEGIFFWRSRSVKSEWDVTEEEVKGMGKIDYESGIIYEKTSEPKIWTKDDLETLKAARAEELRLIGSGQKTCHRQLDHIVLMIDAVMESNQFVEEIISEHAPRPATLADLESTRGWQVIQRVEASLAHAAQVKSSETH